VSLDVDAFLARLRIAGHAVEDLVRRWDAPPTPLALALAFADAGAELDDYQAIKAWVILDEAATDHRAAESLRETVLPDLFEAHIDHLDVSPGLHISDELAARLPLLELASDLTGHLRTGRLLVEGTAPPGLLGCFSDSGPTLGAVIFLDATVEDDELARTFAHELGHALDPDMAMGRVPSLGREAFADAVGVLLLEVEPATVAAAAPLVARALDATRGRRTPRSAWSLSLLLQDVLVEVGASTWAEPELLAARCGGSGRQPGTDGVVSTSDLPQGHDSLLGAALLLRRDGALRPKPPGGTQAHAEEVELPA